MSDDDVRAAEAKGEEKTAAHETVPREAESLERGMRGPTARRGGRRTAG